MIKKELDRLIKPIISDGGFKFKREIKGFSWTREFQERQERIIIGYATSYPNKYQIYYPFVSTHFNRVETIIEEYLEKNNVENQWRQRDTIQSSLHDIESIDYSKFETRIYDTADFNFVAEELNRIIEVGAMPFFEKYNTIEKVADLLADKKPEEVIPYIQGAILLPKTILILKLANHVKFKEKLYEYHKVLITNSGKDVYKQMLTVYDDLFAEDLKNLVIS